MEYFFDWLDYVEYYPCKGEDGYDGTHNGGVKGLSKDAPEDAVKHYNEYKEAQSKGIYY